MASRSWMAAWVFAAVGLTASAHALADDRKTVPAATPSPSSSPTTAPRTAAPAAPTATTTARPRATPASPGDHVVKLDLGIAGLSAKGCDVEIKPGHPGCIFKPKTLHVEASGLASVVFNDVRSETADRDCTFAITIKEPGQSTRTVRRGLRLGADPNPAALRLLTCYFSSPSKLARAEAASETIRR